MYRESQSGFGKMTVLVTDGHLPYPYGYELTGYDVDNLSETLKKATAADANVSERDYLRRFSRRCTAGG